MATAALKAVRIKAKRRLTKKINEAKVLLSEDHIDEINRNELSALYKSFTKAHDEYSEAAYEEETEDQLDTYEEQQQKEYLSVMKEIRDTLRKAKAPEIKTERQASLDTSIEVTREELMGVLSLNSSEYMKPYDSNPLTSHVFMMTFDQTVDKIADPHYKLSLLLRFTKGDAHHAVEGCGDKNKIKRSIIQHLTKSNTIRGNEELQKLADDLVTADLSFDAMKVSYDDQDLITKIIARLNKYHYGRWRKLALDTKEEKAITLTSRNLSSSFNALLLTQTTQSMVLKLKLHQVKREQVEVTVTHCLVKINLNQMSIIVVLNVREIIDCTCVIILNLLM